MANAELLDDDAEPLVARVRVNAQGRIVIPAALRKALGLKAGGTLVLRVEDGQLSGRTPEQAERDLHAMFAHIAPGRSLAAELIAERRAEARAEEAKDNERRQRRASNK